MLPIILFVIAILFSIGHIWITKQRKNLLGIVISYLIFFNIGIMGLLAFYAHTFMAVQTAELIGWAPGNPFQSEIAAANLAFGILGILSLWLRDLFWVATVLGSSIFLFGAFVIHLIQYSLGNTAPLNIGLFIWFGDLIIPLLLLLLLGLYFNQTGLHSPSNKKE